MKYRQFGKLDWKVSALGFGAMRLPIIGGDRSNIDEAEGVRMIRYAIDHGVNYLDTAYRYCDGKSEIVVGKALQDGYREKVRIATKMPIREVTTPEDLDRIFDDQLAKLQTDLIDFYLFHGLRRETWNKVKELNALDWAEKKIAEGKIGYLGFSFHDEFEVLREIVDDYKGWTFFQMQYNYVDTESSSRTPGVEGLKYAAEKGLGVVVMEPVQGGNLAVKPPKEIETLLRDSKSGRSPVDLALQWVWNQPEVSLALSGMSTMDQIIENIRSADLSGPNTLTVDELTSISHIREAFLSHGFIGCTGCRYCQPCPQGVTIPDILALYNDYYKSQNDSLMQQKIREKYDEIVNSGLGADKCVRCGQCEDACPQQLPIRNLISRANMSFRQS
jgi:predicted aldo/keto reductase-like oxidoreductase